MCILISERALQTPFAGQNDFFLSFSLFLGHKREKTKKVQKTHEIGFYQFMYKAHFIHNSFTQNAIHLITRIIWIQDSVTFT